MNNKEFFDKLIVNSETSSEFEKLSGDLQSALEKKEIS